MKTNLILLLMLVASLALPSLATAATRTVCFDLIIHNDDMYDCPTSGTAGARRSCDPNGYSRPVELEVELWDADGSLPDDDYIGTWRQSSGLTCVVFTWEGASYQQGDNETDPDVYVKIKNRVFQAGSYTKLRIITAAGAVYPYPSSRSMQDGIANNCHTGQCMINNGNPFYVNGDPASDYSQALMGMDAGQRTVAVFWSQMPPQVIDIRYPSGDGFCDTPTNSGKTYTTQEVHICEGFMFRASLVPHELGHIIMAEEFGLDPSDITPDYSKGGQNGWYKTSDEYDGAAVIEGWANYVSAVSWWDPENTGSNPWSFDASIMDYVYVEDAEPYVTASCASNRGVPLQTTKALWDLDDANNEAAVSPSVSSDTQNMPTLNVAAIWNLFPSGTGNHETKEVTVNVNGDNLWDFWYWLPVGGQATNFIWHNCVQSQQYP